MFSKIKTLVYDILKNQYIIILITLPIWILPQFLFELKNYKYGLDSILINILVLFLLYGINIIKYNKVYNRAKQLCKESSEHILDTAIFGVNAFWNMMSILLIVGIINYSTTFIPDIITYYINLSLMFIISIISFQGNTYYRKFIKSINQDFIDKLEA